MLSINYTLLIYMVNFLALIFILNAILYKPIRKMLDKRANEISGSEEMIQDFLKKFDRSSDELQENMVGARKEGSAEREELKKQGLEREKELIQQAVASTGEKMTEAKKRIESDILSVRQALESEMSAFSKDLAEKVLGRSL